MAMNYNPDGTHYWAPQRKLGGGWICFKSDPVTPAAPDPVATANAQSQSNIATANAQANLNHTNQVTPWGNQTYTSTPNADGTNSWTGTTTLAPAQQALLDSSNQISQQMADLGKTQIGNVANSINAGPNTASATKVQNNPLQSGVDTSGMPQVQSRIANAGQINGNIGAGGGIQNSLDVSKVPGLVGGADLQKTYGDAQGAAYKQQAAYLDSSYGQKQHDLENQLVQQGVLQGSDAWNRATQNLGEQRTFDYNNAFNNSFSTGLQAQNQIYNQGLASNQNAFGQAVSSGNFANSAQAQGFGQAAAQQQASAQAQAQQFAQNAANTSANNQAQNQQYQQGLASAQLNNQTAGQAFNQSSAQHANDLNEAYASQQNPINILNALRSGSQVTAPQFGSQPQSNVANTDIAGLYNNQYQGQLANYNGQVASNNSTTGAAASVGAAALMAFF